MDAWNDHLNAVAFMNTHQRSQTVLKCIIDGEGTNDLVESMRGKLFWDATALDNNDGKVGTGSGNANRAGHKQQKMVWMPVGEKPWMVQQ